MLVKEGSVSGFTFVYCGLMRDDALSLPLCIFYILAPGCEKTKGGLRKEPAETKEAPSSLAEADERRWKISQKKKTRRGRDGAQAEAEWKVKYRVNNWSQGVSLFQPRALSDKESQLSSLTFAPRHPLSLFLSLFLLLIIQVW